MPAIVPPQSHCRRCGAGGQRFLQRCPRCGKRSWLPAWLAPPGARY